MESEGRLVVAATSIHEGVVFTVVAVEVTIKNNFCFSHESGERQSAEADTKFHSEQNKRCSLVLLMLP